MNSSPKVRENERAARASGNYSQRSAASGDVHAKGQRRVSQSEKTGRMKEKKQNSTVRKSLRREPEIRMRGLLLCMFVVYLAILAYLLFFAEWYDHTTGLRTEYHYNLVPFLEIRRFIRARHSLTPEAVFLNLIGNVIGFIPLGVFLPVGFRRLRKGWRTVLCGCVISLLVEAIQLVTMTGTFDVDDILLNTLGTLIGYLIFGFFRIKAIRRAGRLTGRKRKQ